VLVFFCEGGGGFLICVVAFWVLCRHFRGVFGLCWFLFFVLLNVGGCGLFLFF